MVAQQDFVRTRLQSRGEVSPEWCPEQEHPLGKRSSRLCRRQQGQRLRFEIGSGISDAGDSEPGEALTDRSQVRRCGVDESCVPAPEPSGEPSRRVALDIRVRLVVQLRGGEGRGVEHPQRAAPMLNPHRSIRNDGIQPVTVERTGNVVVIADAAYLSAGGCALACLGQGLRKCCAGSDGGRPELNRIRRGRHREQVKMVIMQAGQQRPAGPFDDFLIRLAPEAARDRRNPSVPDPHVDPPALHFSVADQHAS
jgi:hypothetical protein